MHRISKIDITPAGEPVPLSPLLPGEDRVVYDELKRELLSELRPETAYARRLAVNLVNIEWEIDRHRHLLAAAVKLVAREVLERKLEELNRGYYGGDKPFEGRLVDIAAEVLSDNAAEYGKWLPKLAQAGCSRSDFVTQAYSSRNDHVLYHEAKLANLETRRRQLCADYDAVTARVRRTEQIIDAQTVNQ